MIKKAIAICGLAGILMGNVSEAQTLSTNIQYELLDNSKTKKTSLDSLVEIYNTPAAIQRYVAQNIEYIKNAEKFYPEINKNSAPQGFIRFPSPEKILDKKYGDCEEGFILTAAALKKLGYETMGLAMNPKNGEAGHIYTVYKDTLTNLYGTAGISIEDYISPVYDSIEDLIAGLALKSKYHDFHITAVGVNDDILSDSPYIDLPKEYVKDMNLTDIFGVLFKKENCEFGELEQDIYERNYEIYLQNTIIEPKEHVGIIKGPITKARRVWKPWSSLIEISFHNKHRYKESLSLHFDKNGKPEAIWLEGYDHAKGEISRMENYDYNYEKKVFENKNPLNQGKYQDLSQKDSQAYIDLANYFLKLMKNQETKELWEQTKKQREIKKAKQDSLQKLNKQDSLEIKFPKD